MSEIYQHKCDGCGVVVDSEWSCDRWLPPKDWLRLVDRNEFSKGDCCGRCDPRKHSKPAETGK